MSGPDRADRADSPSEVLGDWAAPKPRAGAEADAPARPGTGQRIAPSIGLLVVAAILALLGRELAAAIAVVASLASEVFPKAFKEDSYLAGLATALGVVTALGLGHLG